MGGLLNQWQFFLPLALGVVSIWGMLPGEQPRSRVLPALLGLIGLGLLGMNFLQPTGDWVRDGLFYTFSSVAVIAAVLMVTDRNPVYAALWFAIVTLGVCGLFLLNSAPFLTAATMIVYAGAIVVTFVFVIMLAQQAGAAGYDRRVQLPFFTCLLAGLLFGTQLLALQKWPGGQVATEPALKSTAFLALSADTPPNPLSRPIEMDGKSDLGSLRGVGRSLFGDYLYEVEIAGTVLLIATIGAIVMAPRRSQGTL